MSIHTKVTAQGAALSSSSRHVPSIHTSWPLSRMVHFYRVCSHRRQFRDATLQLMQKLTRSDFNHPTLNTLARSIAQGSPVSGKGSVRPLISRCSRIILPYHPALSGLARRLVLLDRKFEVAGLSDMRVRVSWSLGGQKDHRLCLAGCACKLKRMTRVA